MGNNKLDALLWENIPFDNMIVTPSSTTITSENIEGIPFEDVDELMISRDAVYNIKISCVRKFNALKTHSGQKKKMDNEILPGEIVPEGSIIVKLFDYYTVELDPCYYNGCESSLEKIDYSINCFHVKGSSGKKPTVLKEWILNGNQAGIGFGDNSLQFEYTVKGATSGKYGDFEFPIGESREERIYCGRFSHIKYKDTAFDVHFVGNGYGPKWSNNFSITYFEKYGRIPEREERDLIRNYMSFFMGKQLMYIGSSSYDNTGNQVGFEMENPRTFGFDIEKICNNAPMSPISCAPNDWNNYFKAIQDHIDSFADIYYKLDFDSLFTTYWYSKNIIKPMDLPILSGALEHLKSQWYKEVENNPETLLMDKKDFAKRIKPIKELIAQQFSDTPYEDRMKRTLDNSNRMSVSEQLAYFFDKIGLKIGKDEKEALKARNLPAHGSYHIFDSDLRKYIINSHVYEDIINRVILKLLGYKGKYVDYGMLGYLLKDIDEPGGNE